MANKVSTPLFPSVAPQSLNGVLNTYPVTTRQSLEGFRTQAYAINKLTNQISAGVGNVALLQTTASAATNAAVLNAAIEQADAAGGGVINLPSGIFNISNLATITSNNLIISGQGGYFGGTELRPTDATGTFINFSGCGRCGLRDLYISGAVTKRVSDAAIVLTGGSFACFFQGLRIEYMYNGIEINGATETRVSDIHVRSMLGTFGIKFGGAAGAASYRLIASDLVCDNPYPVALGSRRTWAATTLFTAGEVVHLNNNIYQCSTTGTTGSVGPSGIPGTTGYSAFTTVIDDGAAKWKFVSTNSLVWFHQDNYAYSLVIDKAALISGAYGYRMTDTAATGSSYPVWAFIWDLEIDHPYFTGMSLERGEGIFCNGSWVGSCLTGNGILIGANFRGEVVIATARIFGNWQHGILMEAGPVQVRLLGNEIGDNSVTGSGTCHGFTVGVNATRFTVVGNTIGDSISVPGNNQGYGVFISAGTSNQYQIVGNDLSGNVSGRISDGGTGTNKVIVDAGSTVNITHLVQDTNFYQDFNSGNPYINFDANDYILYDRSANRLWLPGNGPVYFPRLSGDPGSGAAGDVYYNTTSNVLRFFNGSVWGNV